TTTKVRLQVTESEGASSPPKIENRLSADIKYLLLRDSHGNYFAGRAIRDQARMELAPTDATLAQAELNGLSKPVQPALPVGFDSSSSNDSLFNVLSFHR